MVSTEKCNEPTYNGVYPQPRPSLLPSYSTLFQRQHSAASKRDSESTVVLNVTKLDELGRPSVIQWKYDDDRESHRAHTHNPQGYGVTVTALFIIGEMVGGGIISLPNALYLQGWVGIPVMIAVSLLSGFTGVQLGRCWMILQERWPEVYLKHTQKPYPEIGYRAGGPWCRRFVSLCMILTLVGTATVFLLIVGRNVTMLVENWAGTSPKDTISFCYIIVIVSAILLPVTFLGSPKDFWQVAFGAAGSTTIAVVIMIIGMSMTYGERKETDVTYPPTSFTNFILGYGTILFAYCGQSAFPTIQHDMREPHHFPRAVVGSYAATFFYYLPVSILGYIVYGQHLGDAGVENILALLPTGWVQDTVTVLITLHVMFGFIIFINPINQELESLFGIPSSFTIKRLFLRTATVIFIVFLAESIPAMDLLLDLVGGTTMAFLIFVFPGTFYLKLRWNTSHDTETDKPISKWEYLVTGFIILIGILGAIASVYAFVTSVAGGNALFKLPCYIDNSNE